MRAKWREYTGLDINPQEGDKSNYVRFPISV